MTLIKKGLPGFHPSKPKPGLLGTPALPNLKSGANSQELKANGWKRAVAESKRLLRRQ
jgi:hypothetical protein